MDDNFLNERLKDQLNDFEASPSEEAWAGINKHLQQERKIMRYERRSAVIILLLLLIFVPFLVLKPINQGHMVKKVNPSEEIITPSIADKKPTVSQNNFQGDVTSENGQLVDSHAINENDGNTYQARNGIKETNNGFVIEESMTLESGLPINLLDSRPIITHSLLTFDVKVQSGASRANASHKNQGVNGKSPELKVEKSKIKNEFLVGLKDQEIDVDDEPVMPNKGDNLKKVRLFALATPSLLMNKLQTNKNDNVLIGDLQDRPAITADRLGYMTTMGASISLSNKFEITTGLSYTWSNEKFEFTESRLTSYEVTESNTNSFNLNPILSKTDQVVKINRREVGLQLGLAMMLAPGNRIKQFVGSNFQINRNINRRVTTEGDMEDFQLQKYYAQASIFYRFEYKLNRQFDFLFQPTFSYVTISDKQTDAPITIKPNNVSLSFGFAYQL